METKMQKAIVVGLIVLLIARLISEILVITSAILKRRTREIPWCGIGQEKSHSSRCRISDHRQRHCSGFGDKKRYGDIRIARTLMFVYLTSEV